MADRKRLFTYGDKVQRKGDGPVRTVQDIGPTAYYFADGTFALVADEDCYTLVEKSSGFFRVAASMDGLPVDDYLQSGYEYREDFIAGLKKLLDYWAGRTGERIDDRNKFLLLRFHDTPGGLPDEAWLPLYMLTPCDAPDCVTRPAEDRPSKERELDEAFGFD